MWFLSFDCATKSFAYSLVEILLDEVGECRAKLATCKERLLAICEELRKARGSESGTTATLAALAKEVAALDAQTRRLVRVAAGETVDLFPGRKDGDIRTPERLKAVARFVEDRVKPLAARLAGGADRFDVAIEFQMGANARTRAVAAGLVALFFRNRTFFVGPSLKGRICLGPGLHHGDFCEKYASSYTASKKHALANFKKLETMFCSELPTMSDDKKGHIADSVLQVLAHQRYGDQLSAELHF